MKRWLSILLVMVMLMSVFGTAAVSAAATKTVTVTLAAGKDAAAMNLSTLQEAFDQAEKGLELTVKINSSGTYYIGRDTNRSLILFPHTTFDLGGATLMRAGQMGNMIQNCDYNGGRTAGGYDLSENITVKNGTLNGNGGSTVDANLCNIGHATSVNFENMNFRNCYSHLIEYSGCQNCVVKNCTFSGLNNYKDDAIEALQFDICDAKWNGIFTGDGTVCRNMTADGCTFLDYPSGVGNHKCIYGKHNTGITIKNCTFKNTKSSTQGAMWIYGFDNSLITGNTITGKYGSGIYVSGCQNTTVSNNNIKLAGTSIYVTVGRGYTNVSKGTRSEEYCKGIDITGNTLYDSKSNRALEVQSGSVVNNIKNNTVTCVKGFGIYANVSTVKNITSNTVKNCGDTGIMLTSTGVTSAVDKNTVTGCAGYGIRVNNSSITITFSGNTLKNNKLGASYINSKIVKAAKTLATPKISSVTAAYSGAVIKWGKVSGAVKYRVFRKNGSSWKKLGDTTAVSYTDKTAVSGKVNTYTVRCISADGSKYTSGFSTTGKSISYVAAPAPPTLKNTKNGVQITYKKPAGGTYFRIFRKTGSGGWKKLKDTTSTTLYDKTAKNGVKYSYTVRCINKGGTKYLSAYHTTGKTITCKR